MQIINMELTDLMERLAILTERVNNMKLKNEISLFAIAIVDFFTLDKAMDQINPDVQPFVNSLKMLCFENNEDPDVLTYKSFILHEKLRSMPFDVRSTFTAMYPGLIDKVLLYLDQNPPELVSVDKWVQTDVEFWWM